MVSCFNPVLRANFCLSLGLAAKLPTTNQNKTKNMQWRVVAIFAGILAASDCGPFAGPSDLSRALGSVLDAETTMGKKLIY